MRIKFSEVIVILFSLSLLFDNNSNLIIVNAAPPTACFHTSSIRDRQMCKYILQNSNFCEQNNTINQCFKHQYHRRGFGFNYRHSDDDGGATIVGSGIARIFGKSPSVADIIGDHSIYNANSSNEIIPHLKSAYLYHWCLLSTAKFKNSSTKANTATISVFNVKYCYLIIFVLLYIFLWQL